MILLVDDDDLTRRALQRLLGATGRDVIGAGTGDEALTLVSPRFSAVVTDLDLGDPKSDGLSVLARAREVAPRALRILMSGSDPGLLEHAMSAGLAHMTFVKPVGDDLLAWLALTLRVRAEQR